MLFRRRSAVLSLATGATLAATVALAPTASAVVDRGYVFVTRHKVSCPGETYDRNALIVSTHHSSCGSYLSVTSMVTKRTVTVKVIDQRRRHVALSPAAAEKIGLGRQVLVNVEKVRE